jgi:hypothetical protein
MPVKNFEILNTNTDQTTTRTLLHEAIPVTGTVVSGTYGTFPNENNIKNYTHGMFQSVYDYPYLSSSANHIFDITCGFDESSGLSGSANAVQESKKINLYNQFSQVLLGYTGSNNEVEVFESDLNIADNNNQMKQCFFINFSRLLAKDQIKQGSFTLVLGTGSWANPYSDDYGPTRVTLTDASASSTDEGTTTSIGGDYGVLYESNANSAVGQRGQNAAQGIIFYQTGMVVLSSSIFTSGTSGDAGVNHTNDFLNIGSAVQNVTESLVKSAISGNCDALRHRIYNLSYNNTTEINSTIYFCRVPHNKFNYSSNPTYLSGSKIRVKTKASDNPVSYITTIGLYNSSNELLAVAKLSEPLKKTPENEITLRVRLDY